MTTIKRIFISLLVFLLFVFIMPGCTIPQEITGPTWTTKITAPLIERTAANNGEIRLDGTMNGLGETGLDLTGINLRTTTAEGNWQTDPFGTIIAAPGAVADVSLVDPGAGTTVPIDETTPFNAGTSYQSITMSGNYAAGATNDVAISLSGCVAGGDGLIIQIEDAGPTSSPGPRSIAMARVRIWP